MALADKEGDALVMRFPPSFIDELRQRTSLVQVVERKVTWDNRKSNPARGDMWACCPFHEEKTPSFHVDERKGFYHCFGCEASGNAFTFIQEAENVSFSEAVAELARLAGMALPPPDESTKQKYDYRQQLIEITKTAAQYFRLQLKTNAGAPARAYLERRGLKPETLARWGIGYSLDSWDALLTHLRQKGIADEMILAAGLAKTSEKGGAPYDFFRNRVMFPIRDHQDQTIAFGARAVADDEVAKYINSPETEIFSKGKCLYNFGPARAAIGKEQSLIVAEGYMDVIALSEAGFPATVAPLGTAITEQQLQMIWRVAPEPIIALDGDRAGLHAATRLIDRALPMLEAGKSLYFAVMPEGQDPDDLLRNSGPQALQVVLKQATAMVNFLFERAAEGKRVDSPERKAALENALNARIRPIRDNSIRNHYAQAVKDFCWQLFRANRSANQQHTNRISAPAAVGSSTRQSLLATASDGTEENIRESVILAAVIAAPSIADEFENGLLNLRCLDPNLSAIRDAIVGNSAKSSEELKQTISADLGQVALEKLFSQRHVALTPCIRQADNAKIARRTVAGELEKLIAYRAVQTEVVEAAEDLRNKADERVVSRLRVTSAALDRAHRNRQEEGTDYIVSDNGVRVDRSERAAHEDLLRRIGSVR